MRGEIVIQRNLIHLVIGVFIFLLGMNISHASSFSPSTLKIVDGKVNHGAICSNHQYGSVEYRDCRTRAKKYFEKRCKQLSNQKGADRRLRESFCYSARNFNPVQ